METTFIVKKQLVVTHVNLRVVYNQNHKLDHGDYSYSIGRYTNHYILDILYFILRSKIFIIKYTFFKIHISADGLITFNIISLVLICTSVITLYSLSGEGSDLVSIKLGTDMDRLHCANELSYLVVLP